MGEPRTWIRDELVTRVLFGPGNGLATRNSRGALAFSHTLVISSYSLAQREPWTCIRIRPEKRQYLGVFTLVWVLASAAHRDPHPPDVQEKHFLLLYKGYVVRMVKAATCTVTAASASTDSRKICARGIHDIPWWRG